MPLRLPGSLSLKEKSIKYRLIVAFCLLSILPMIVAQVVSYYSLVGILQRKIDVLENDNLLQTRKIIGTKLDFYQDLLYQMYTDDRMIDLMERLNEGQDVEFTTGQLRRVLHSYIYAMPYVQSIAVLTDGGRMVFDDLLTGYNTKSSWLDASGDRPSLLFRSVADSQGTSFFTTEPTSLYAGKRHYLFHMAHRFVKTRNIWAKSGIIILSIDEQMLSEICDENFGAESGGPAEGAIFIMADDGTLISHPKESLLGTKLDLPADPARRAAAVGRTIWGGASNAGGKSSLYAIREPETGWNVIAVRDLSVTYGEISGLQRIAIVVILVTVSVLLATIFYITGRMTRSIDSVAGAMNVAAAGELSVRIEIRDGMPPEVQKIAKSFNFMIGKIDDLLREVQASLTRQRNAEIAALEAQVNPHFLYNTLDTINWMAIDREAFEISDAIGALAEILRYAIDDSNAEVEISREVEWLKRYVTLQQMRLMGSFDFRLDLDPSILDLRIHKLLFQPFVENSIIHGFKAPGKAYELSFSMRREGRRLLTTIADSGAGIAAATLADLHAGAHIDTGRKGHIGIRTAIERIRMYYGAESEVDIDSSPREGTRIRIALPLCAPGRDGA
jgi:two-component system sensor histidine kinase YesM